MKPPADVTMEWQSWYWSAHSGRGGVTLGWRLRDMELWGFRLREKPPPQTRISGPGLRHGWKGSQEKEES